MAAATASRIISPRAAFFIISLGAFAGPLVAGTAVAATIGHGIINYSKIGALPLSSGIAAGLCTVLLAYLLRFPTSGSVALVSATIGSLVELHRLQLVEWHGVEKVGVAICASIVAGFAIGAGVYVILVALFSRVSFDTGMRWMRLQYASVALQAFGYGANDAEKMMGLMTAAMLLGNSQARFTVPFWIIAVAILAFALGMALGGVRIARTIGGRLFRIRPLHALSFQIAAASTVLTAAALGGPLSTTETTASAIMGVGAVANPRALRWQVARELVTAWFLTIPIGLLLGWIVTLMFGATHLFS